MMTTVEYNAYITDRNARRHASKLCYEAKELCMRLCDVKVYTDAQLARWVRIQRRATARMERRLAAFPR